MTPAFIFNISQGTLTRDDALYLTGVWSGHSAGYNNPAMVSAKGVGPLPPGYYSAGPLEAMHRTLGPFVMALTRADDGETYGRGSFYIHGASATHPELSSDGCIIVPRSYRIDMAKVFADGKNRIVQVTL